MMRFKYLSNFLFLLLSFSTITHAFTYWLDRTCLAYPAGPGKTLSLRDGGVFEEVFQMGKRASERMDRMSITSTNAWDRDFARSYAYIFNDDKARSRGIERSWQWREKYGGDGKDTVYNVVFNTMASIGNDWTETRVKLEADVRFFCDNGAHWTADPGGEGYGSFDNNMLSEINCNSPGMQGQLMAFETHDRISYTDPVDNGDVSLITIYDAAFERGRSYGNSDIRLPATIGEMRKLGRVKKGARIDHFEVLSCIILHELTHTWQYLHEDHTPDEDDSDASEAETGGWESVLFQDEDKGALNSDSYVALLLDGASSEKKGYTLDRDYVTNPEKLVKGKIRHYPDLKGTPRK
ncbi:hypothetical protein BN1723_004728 [Verticillium longisporum]|uniref:Lysine-specific metallo-endopeptidase domain-containing protein n=1 Tax=Verticillium longisporum TaxID=100787 RepID=A0A0G4N1A7_VERLO|nr:hypothetical protein BN1723_004728 [Verticillium longisporum]